MTVPIGAKLVATVAKALQRGGGESTATLCASVSENTSASSVGNRYGSARSVSPEMPAGTSGTASRSRSTADRARWRRVGSPGPAEARIDRETSTKKTTSDLVRADTVSVVVTTGWAAASPSATHAVEDATVSGRPLAPMPGGGRSSSPRAPAAAPREGAWLLGAARSGRRGARRASGGRGSRAPSQYPAPAVPAPAPAPDLPRLPAPNPGLSRMATTTIRRNSSSRLYFG